MTGTINMTFCACWTIIKYIGDCIMNKAFPLETLDKNDCVFIRIYSHFLIYFPLLIVKENLINQAVDC